MIRSLPGARLAQVTAVAEMATGGWMLLVNGARPEQHGLDPTQVMVRMRIPADAVAVNDRDVVATLGPLTGAVDKAGTVGWFCITTRDGEPVMDGTVGLSRELDSADTLLVPDDGALVPRAFDILLNRVQLLRGDTVTVEVVAIKARER
ncbi:MAG: hypothetical protein VW405_05940 [Rhodospirillaceae bacterium]